MKYYAVTDDPNELLHYGVKGMKWGQHLFGDDLRPKSAGYKRALGKLRASAAKKISTAKSAIHNSSVQRAKNRQKKEQDKYRKAVAETQRRIQISENLHNLTGLENYERSIKQQYRAENKANKAAAKRERRYAKNERKMDKFMQEAREGRLRYGKLSDDQIGRIKDRLTFENTARAVGGREKPKWRLQKREALREGILQGITQGTAAGMKEIAVAAVQNKLSNKKVLDKNSAQEAERQKQASRIKNRRTHKEMAEDVKQEALDAQIREGVGYRNRGNWTAAGAAKTLQKMDRLRDDREFNIQEAHNHLQTERQNRENEERAERQRELYGKMAYEFGYVPASTTNNGGGGGNNNQQQGQGKKKNKGGGGGNLPTGISNDEKTVEAWANWYKRVKLDGETIQQKQVKAIVEAQKQKAAADRRESLNKLMNPIDKLQQRLEEENKRNIANYKELADFNKQRKAQEKAQKDLNADLERYAQQQRKIENAAKNTSNKKKQQQKNNAKKRPPVSGWKEDLPDMFEHNKKKGRR